MLIVLYQSVYSGINCFTCSVCLLITVATMLITVATMLITVATLLITITILLINVAFPIVGLSPDILVKPFNIFLGYNFNKQTVKTLKLTCILDICMVETPEDRFDMIWLVS